MDRLVALSVPIDRVRIDPEGRNRTPNSPVQDHLLRASIRKRGILEPLQVSDEGANKGYVIIDGERRYRIAKVNGNERLVCVVHPHMSSESREELRMELKMTVKPVD